MEIKYKDSNNQVHQIEEGFEHLMSGWPMGYTQITEIEAAQLLASPAPTIDQIKSSLEQAVQAHLDAGAKLAGYDNILSACSYAGAPNAYQAEGASFIAWRGAVWVYCNALVASVLNGTSPIPTVQELISTLPRRTLN